MLKMFLAAISGYAVAYSLYFVQIKNPHVAEIFVGIIIMIPLGFMVLSDQDHLANRSDMWVGKLAYPLFLVHYLAISIVDTFAAGHLGSLRVAACVTLSLLLAIPVAFAQELVDRARYRIRGFGNEKPSSH
jgi:peptidoglycan/LPS O-acetylase OafA/YrhL